MLTDTQEGEAGEGTLPQVTCTGACILQHTSRRCLHAITEEDIHGEVNALAIRSEDGMGPGPQSTRRLLDMRTADRLQPRAVERGRVVGT